MKKKGKYISWHRKEQEKQMSGKPSLETKEENSVSSLQVSPPGIQSLGTYHKSIKTLVYEDFLTILTTEELKPLVISGEPPIDELVTAWESITDEYSNAIKTPKSDSIYACYKKIKRTEAYIKLVDWCLLILTEEYDEQFAKMIAEMGYNMIEPCDDKEEYLRRIKIVKLQASTLIVLLNQYQNEYNLLAPGDDKAKRDYQSYMDELALLSRHQGGGLIQPKSITVAQYISIVNSFMSYHDALRMHQERNEKKNG